MKRLCILAGTTVAGYAGWLGATAAGFDFFGAFVVSGIASVVGVYAGWKVAQRFE